MAAKKSKTRYLNIDVNSSGFLSRIIGSRKNAYDSSDVSLLKQLLSKEKARILYVLKNNKPKSIYELAKILGRDFKSVRDDLKLLEKFGFIEFYETKNGKRRSLTPNLIVNQVNVVVNI